MDPGHPGCHLFQQYHSNESTDPDRIGFHALGAWRVLPALRWNPAFLVPASQLLGGPVRFWHNQFFAKPARMVDWWHGTRPRRATVVKVLREGVKSNSDKPLLQAVTAIRRGRKMDRQFFPLRFDPGSARATVSFGAAASRVPTHTN